MTAAGIDKQKWKKSANLKIKSSANCLGCSREQKYSSTIPQEAVLSMSPQSSSIVCHPNNILLTSIFNFKIQHAVVAATFSEPILQKASVAALLISKKPSLILLKPHNYVQKNKRISYSVCYRDFIFTSSNKLTLLTTARAASNAKMELRVSHASWQTEAIMITITWKKFPPI